MDQNKILKASGIVFLLLILLTLFTQYYGSTDIGDYADSAKYFAGDYQAKIRNSHSYTFGLLHAPLLMIFDSFIWFKITSLVILSLICLSVYLLTDKNPYSLLLFLLSPIVWYTSPWIGPLQLSSLCLLWAFYFLRKFDRTNSLVCCIFAGLLLGLAWTIWNTILFITFFAWICFFWNKRLSSSAIFLVSVFGGLLPLLAIDTILFGFPFYTLLKTTASNFVGTLMGGIRGSVFNPYNRIFLFLTIFLTLPLFSWKLFHKKFSNNNFKEILFVGLTLLLILSNPQIRYMIILVPIILVMLIPSLSEKEIKWSLILSILLSLIFIIPYIAQVGFWFNGSQYGYEIREFTAKIGTLNLDSTSFSEKINTDLAEIESQYGSQSFIVGNAEDDYQTLAHYYDGGITKEFISVEDYHLFSQNSSIIFERGYVSRPKISERRQIWLKGGISKTEPDTTDYDSINYLISVSEPSNEPGFTLVEQYSELYLYRKQR